MTKVTASQERVHPFIIHDWKAVEGCIVMRINCAFVVPKPPEDRFLASRPN